MTGMDTVVDLRRQRFKPAAVMVDLIARAAKKDPYSLSPSGIVTVNIGADDSLADIDFRPLIGLMVFVSDHTGNTTRHRKVAALIADADAAHLVMPVWHGDAIAVHQRWAGEPPRTESFRA